MTFSYVAFATDKDRVRFHLADTDASAPKFSDEDIAAAITEYGGYKPAVIGFIKYQIMLLSSTPDFTADWLKVSSSSAIASLRKLLDEKLEEFEIVSGSINTDGVHVYRYDSDQLTPPDYQP
ncbi:MAG: hypothetical protein E6Q97_30530 [Desulfurellales bacterium]|nr:MAG: hypothetical protein E6Q97_30530 [Desulfurellales bacterium]